MSWFPVLPFAKSQHGFSRDRLATWLVLPVAAAHRSNIGGVRSILDKQWSDMSQGQLISPWDWGRVEDLQTSSDEPVGSLVGLELGES